MPTTLCLALGTRIAPTPLSIGCAAAIIDSAPTLKIAHPDTPNNARGRTGDQSLLANIAQKMAVTPRSTRGVER
jgi:hypothetical protein